MVEHSINLEHCIELQNTNILSTKYKYSNILHSVLLTSLGSLRRLVLILLFLIATQFLPFLSTPKMEMAGSSELFTLIYQTTLHLIPENSNLDY
jgi:hypothetical protein